MHYCAAFLKFRPGTPDTFIDELTAEFKKLPAEVDGMREIHAGVNLKRDASTFDESVTFDYGFIYVFEDMKAFEGYLPHPAHLRLFEMAKPYFAEVAHPEVALIFSD
jgi:Stress responsive A/B Barrel Domain